MEGVVITRNEKLTLRVNSNVKEALQDLANEKGVSLSSFINNLLIEELKRENVSIISFTKIL